MAPPPPPPPPVVDLPLDFTTLDYWATPAFETDLEGFGLEEAFSITSPDGNRVLTARLPSVDGNPSDGPQAAMGIVTWSGIFVGLNFTTTTDLTGTVSASMNLEDTDHLEVGFVVDGVPTDDYTLSRSIVIENLWVWNDQSTTFVDARFYAAGSDPSGVVAGRLDLVTPSIQGAWGASREN